MRADARSVGLARFLHGQCGLVELAEPRLVALVADVEARVLTQAQGGEQVLRLVGRHSGSGRGARPRAGRAPERDRDPDEQHRPGQTS